MKKTTDRRANHRRRWRWQQQQQQSVLSIDSFIAFVFSMLIHSVYCKYCSSRTTALRCQTLLMAAVVSFGCLTLLVLFSLFLAHLSFLSIDLIALKSSSSVWMFEQTIYDNKTQRNDSNNKQKKLVHFLDAVVWNTGSRLLESLARKAMQEAANLCSV